MLLSIKRKLKLNKSQTTMMTKHAGIARFTYNWVLATWSNLYQDGIEPNKYLLKKLFKNHLKPDFTWIKQTEISHKITQYALDNIEDSFSRFFSKKGGHPKFKKKEHHDSFTIDAGCKPIPVGGTSIKLPTIGWVKTFERLPHTTCKSITISPSADSWFIAFAYEQEQEPTVKQHDVVGVNLGVKELATLSTKVVFPNPRHYKTHLSKLRRLSKELCRKTKASSNRHHKAKIQLEKDHGKVASFRKDTLEQITTYLCKKQAKIIVVVEDLTVYGMLADHKLAQVICDCGFYEFKRQLEYKARKFGCEVIIADPWFPSSKTCSNCGHIQDMLLKERTYNCGSCGHSMDRDLNAAINLSRLALIVKAYPRDSRSHAPVEVRSKCLDKYRICIAAKIMIADPQAKDTGVKTPRWFSSQHFL